jgi:hypothetical protein
MVKTESNAVFNNVMRENENEEVTNTQHKKNEIENDTKELNFKVRTSHIFKKLLPPRLNCLTLSSRFQYCLAIPNNN